MVFDLSHLIRVLSKTSQQFLVETTLRPASRLRRVVPFLESHTVPFIGSTSIVREEDVAPRFVFGTAFLFSERTLHNCHDA